MSDKNAAVLTIIGLALSGFLLINLISKVQERQQKVASINSVLKNKEHFQKVEYAPKRTEGITGNTSVRSSVEVVSDNVTTEVQVN